MANWYTYPITQDYGTNGETGRDFGTPNNTPVFFPVGGIVLGADWQVYGGEVAVKVPGRNIIEYFIHLNDIFVKPGQQIQAGQIIGTTGGGIGDKILKGGIVQNATSQSDYQGHSSGYHTEFGLFSGNTWNDYNSAWSNPKQQLNPLAFTNALIRGGISAAQGVLGVGTGSPNIDPLNSTNSGGSSSGIPGLDQLANVNSFFSNANSFVTSTNWGDWGIRGGLIVGGIVLVVVALLLVFKGNSSESTSDAS